jgi:hypothetical protein
VIEAHNAPQLLAARGRFSLVEGKVLSVRESGGTIYLNFGRRWSEALTVAISKRHERIFSGAGLSLNGLRAGRCDSGLDRGTQWSEDRGQSARTDRGSRTELMRNDWGTGGMQNGARGIGRALPVLLGLSLALGCCFAVGTPTNQRVTLPDPPRDSGAPPPAVREHQRILSVYSGNLRRSPP